MLKQLASREEHSYEWIDLTNPDEAEMHDVAGRYGLHEASVNDALQTDHLPKYEVMQHYTFLILRSYDPANDIQSDTVTELTNKIAVVISEAFIITIHHNS